MHVKDGNGALKYRVVQDSSIGLLDKIFPCLASAETVYGIHPVRPGETGAGLSNGDRILPAVGSYAEVMAKKNACGACECGRLSLSLCMLIRFSHCVLRTFF